MFIGSIDTQTNMLWDPARGQYGSLLKRTAATSLLWPPFWTVTEPAPCLLVPLSGFLAPRRREQRKNGEKTSKNGRETAI